MLPCRLVHGDCAPPVRPPQAVRFEDKKDFKVCSKRDPMRLGTGRHRLKCNNIRVRNIDLPAT